MSHRTWTAVATVLAGLAAGAVTGCGAAGSTTHVRAQATGTAASASVDRPPPVHVSKRLRAQEAALHHRVSASLRSSRTSGGRYGTIPRDLRGHQTAPRDQVLSARPGHPAQPIAGIAVRLHLASGSALALGVGPYVPVRDQGSFHDHTAATWRITFSDVHGAVPVRPRMFTITDEQGQTLEPRVSVLGGGALPRTVPRGRTLTIVLAARTSIGRGTLMYAPTGGRGLVSWVFDAETD